MSSVIDRFAEMRVAVVGDLMLDCYLHGDVRRISPEAPVPVVHARSERFVAGGAANVAANVASLGASVQLVGVCGLDAARNQLFSCLSATGDVAFDRVVSSPQRRTTTKLRIIGSNQQMMRIDHEDTSPCDQPMETKVINAARAAVGSAKIAILSDYGKGVCSDALIRAVIDEGAARGCRILVDPKRLDFAVYRGASVITPNRKELTDATGMPCETDEEAAAAVGVAQQRCGADILLTRSEKGMSYFPLHGEPIHMATVAQDVFDVSGAGDTVVAVLACAFAAGLTLSDAMRMANHAAGIVVSKLGTAVITRDELVASLARQDAAADVPDAGVPDASGAGGEPIDGDTLLALCGSWRGQRMTVAVAYGAFDVFGPQTVTALREARLRCDRLVVLLDADAAEERATLVGALRFVDAVSMCTAEKREDLIAAIHPDVVVNTAPGMAQESASAAPRARPRPASQR